MLITVGACGSALFLAWRGAVCSCRLSTTGAACDGWRAMPGWNYQFPRDHGAHPDFKTEWWYFTGELHAADGREFGYEMTWFRQGVMPEAAGGGIAVHRVRISSSRTSRCRIWPRGGLTLRKRFRAGRLWRGGMRRWEARGGWRGSTIGG